MAASICNNLVLGGYGDWFLPSEIELNTMYYKLKQMNLGDFVVTNVTASYYWSSTQANSTSAYVSSFFDGHIYTLIKGGDGNVRAVREF